MNETATAKKKDLNKKDIKNLRGELPIIILFFLVSLYFFFGSFSYKVEASTVPMLVGAAIAILTGLRLFHIIFPRSSIWQFKEAGLAGEFDTIKEEIEEEILKGKYEEAPAKEITFKDEKKAFLALIGSCISFLLFGYLIGMFFVIVGTSYYYGYRKYLHVAISLAAMYLICYVLLYRVLGAPVDYGFLLTPLFDPLR